ncbi:OmpA/MotB family outer membrane protein [Zunongwangia profunda SM-A87]|jgi:outer membrane protein OmpA-like peptidoglycan-associated protein|uniref:OmpA/MotB family outer membrane protein n=2 Tax=Zunongwangia profunda TaxID=398743 RepID=D5BFB7_ZUNPS|nr:OmpA/MotB family outer membrane protein [Zunongwangia profunda SM-A87]|tara:strand:- start:1082 stop:1780 length:699 start_codon:yes stop_codon:yes gene_type:complete
MMKKTINKIVAVFFAASVLVSCDAIQNANNKQKGAVIGSAGGAAIGGVIGNNTGDGNSALGAIIGGVVGGAAGAYIGNRMDKQAKKIETEVPGAEVERVGEGINVTFDENSGVYFATEKYNINAKSEETLNKLANIFKEYPDTNILVEGHTDNTGSESYNLTLSKNRAQAVTNFLTDHGIAASRFDTKWYGEAQPKYDNSTAEGRSKNRRVEIAIVANEDLKQEAEQKTSEN